MRTSIDTIGCRVGVIRAKARIIIGKCCAGGNAESLILIEEIRICQHVQSCQITGANLVFVGNRLNSIVGCDIVGNVAGRNIKIQNGSTAGKNYASRRINVSKAILTSQIIRCSALSSYFLNEAEVLAVL